MADIRDQARHLSQLHLLKQASLLDGHGGKGGDDGQKGEIIFVELAVPLIDDIQDPDRTALPLFERQGDHVVGPVAGHQVNPGKMPRILLDIADDGGLPRFKDRSGNALIPWKGRAEHRFRLPPDHIAKDQPLRVIVGKEDRAGLGPDDLERGLQHVLDQILQAAVLEEGLGEAPGRL